MQLYIMRHGIAERSAPGQHDAERRLTPDGIRQTESLGKWLQTAGISFSRIVASPYIRANETATAIARTTGYQSKIDNDRRLVPSGSAEECHGLIREYVDISALLLVSHLPLVAELVAALCADGRLQIEMPPTTLVGLRVDRMRGTPQATLRWVLQAGILEQHV